MTVELRPLGVACNIHCQYCYQHPQRDAGNLRESYDLEKMKASCEKLGGSFSLFGGEPLLIPERDLEDLWAWGYQKYGGNGIQTNGTLINDNHIRLFRKYKVYVGISVDGPGELNDARWAGSLDKTRASTAAIHAAIEKLTKEDIPMSLIVTLSKCNATADKLPLMHDWFRYLESIGVQSARIHILEVESDSVEDKYSLSAEENVAAFLSFARLEEQKLKTLKFDIFGDMRNLLLGTDNCVTCIWTACDAYTTRAVQGVEGNGQSSNCGRTNKDGIDFTKASHEGFERYLALHYTPQEYGGCNGCRFFIMCKGQCPGTAVNGDWRNRTADCEVWKTLFRHIEEELIEQGQKVVSTQPERIQVEQMMVESWMRGQSISIAQALQKLNPGQAVSNTQCQQSNHGDHWDSHGDHTDANRQ